MPRVIIIGGGLAGLSSAVHLTNNNIKVILLEGSPKPGGRAYSFNHGGRESPVDNGQHIMMGCYENTLEFLRTIGAESNVEFQERLSVPFAERGGRIHYLKAKSNIYPVNLLLAILSFSSLGIPDRFGVLKLFAKLLFLNPVSLAGLNVSEWLDINGQPERARRALWDILAVGTLNTSLEKASAETFADVLKKIFLKGNKSSVILLPRTGLTEMYVNDSLRFLEKNGSKVILSERVVKILTEGSKIIGVKTASGLYDDFDHVIAAVPHYDLKKILSDSNGLIQIPDSLSYSPILSAHLWLNENPFKKRFYGLVDSSVHWLFNNGSHVTIVTSNAGDLINFENEEIILRFYSELENYFPIFDRNLVNDFKVIKEKRATFIPTIETEAARKKISNSVINLEIAGDWTNTGFPSTIEGAVLSGKTAAERVIRTIYR